MKTYQKPFSQVDLRVPSLEQALPFYRQLLSALKFTHMFDISAWKVLANADTPASTPTHNAPGSWVDDPAEAERIARLIGEGGGKVSSAPHLFTIRPSHYAVFFEDPNGNQFQGMRRLE